MYAGVPTLIPVAVSRLAARRRRARAMPKSATSGVAVAREEDVLRLDVAVEDAVLVRVAERLAASRATRSASSSGSCPSRRSRSRSDSPSTNGMVNQSWPAASPES